ncbi:hypothetical protein DAEQUDRAFT_767051 [Daedalea quercina L-15889]|uniref:Uncharacterized protein n=1 Tax=Daedalea quercina L-15889 TaxID=1314783 RepID=A0A165NXH8_9APHY|nr:hypothetical protein DAEQUDRAFT_767051 [Daedalea quercina L-15889]
MSAQDLINCLFPLPSSPPSSRCPERFPGITHKTKLAVTRALKDNHTQLHAFRNEQGLHNHMSHQLLAVFAMGGSTPLYDSIYKIQEPRLLTAFESPENITQENYHMFLGNKEYYDAYLEYFHGVVLERGYAATLEEYVFSRSASFPETGAPRRMVNCLLARLFHPIIYLGCGLEFNIPGLVAEGLAQMAVHPKEVPSLLLASDYEVPEDAVDAPDLSPVRTEFSSMALNERKRASLTNGYLRRNGTLAVHVFTVLARVAQDDRFKPSVLGLKPHEDQFEAVYLLERVGKEVGSAIVEHASDWLPDDCADADVLEAKVEELSWLATLLYGVCGWKQDGFVADFYLMHVVTSSIFLPSFLAYLSPTSATVLLRTFLRTSLAWYVARGRPALPIREFYVGMDSSLAPKPEGSKLAAADTANPWLSVVQQALIHGDDHLPKTQRALAHFARVYGERAAGTFEGLDGAELLDGTLFVRVAEATRKRTDAPGCPWDFSGFFE